MNNQRIVAAVAMIALGGIWGAPVTRAQEQPAQQNGVGATVQRAQARGFNEHDQQVLRDWFRNHPNEFGESADEQWSRQDIGAYLQVDGYFDETLRQIASSLPSALASELNALPSGWRYAMIGHNVCIVDGESTIRDVFRFDAFNARDREAVQKWSREHPAAATPSAPVNNAALNQTILIGRVIDPDLQAQAQNAPEDLVSRLAPAPFDWKYMTIGNRLCLVDHDWRVHEILQF